MKKSLLLLTAAVTAAMFTFSSAAAEAQRSILVCSECGAQLIRECIEYSQPCFKSYGSGVIPLTIITEVHEEGGCEHLIK